MVFAFANLLNYNRSLRYMGNKKVSIIICTLNRPESLSRCVESIKKQSFTDYELIICEEEGRLVELKDKGWRRAKGDIVVWVDDDIVAEAGWLANIVTIFDTRSDIVGVTGATPVPTEYLKNRDIFKKGGVVKWFYDRFFLEGREYLPGVITRCGANTYGANFHTPYQTEWQYVDFLEPSQFAIRKSVLELVNGFDLGFEGLGEWCDVDLCYRIKQYGALLYHPMVKVYHYPINDDTANKRLETASRYRNYCRWANRYIKKSFKHRLYRLFIWLYYKLKGLRLI